MKNTREKIINAAIETLGRKPSATMEEIADETGLNRRTLHRYFKGRSDLIEAIIEHTAAICFSNLQHALKVSDDPLQQLKAMFLNDIKCGYQFRFLHGFNEEIENNKKSASPEYAEMMKSFRKLLEMLVQRKLTSPNLTLDWIEKLYFSMVETAIKAIMEEDYEADKWHEMAWLSYWNAIKQ
ncbi:TetR/AcrR family transcriptional regulator [Xanthovirga aplysinae]|uniref:TetR/AcrR family transcriptional regulator n=1 Tax=Xanthovirga aplysinae TaxID=2529853 RepID=UPI0012BCDE18|nr:TetR/AcrR family transcriptional regulator [Xanthovirga aplysinae]MTI31658.1 TetR/AcrR family transcriptional regulator [Xanthovirga aplysinae]